MTNTTGELRNTEVGALQRAAFDEAKRQLEIPDGRRGVLVLAVDNEGAEIGGAFLTKRGWTIEPSLKVEGFKGRPQVRFLTRVVF